MALGVEGSVNRGRSLAQQQLTLPEIVDGFTRFLRPVVLDLQCIVIIGIDELDKLESDEKAQRFLNEIKAIFGMEGVYYLISVSENAMSNFERRGLPFRDAFDSSFDKVISVDCLSFDNARRMLNERVVGMPLQFQALCHCLSGGLARELIRSCRDLVRQAADASNAQDLASMAHALVGRDLAARARAVSFAAQRIEVEPERSQLLLLLDRVSTAPVSAEALHKAHAQLAVPDEPVPAGVDTRAVELARLQRLALEVGSYFYYLAAILEFFTNALDQPAMERAVAGPVDAFARALLALAISPRLTRSMVDALRLAR